MPTIALKKNLINEEIKTIVVPELYLRGRSARKLDKRVKETLKEHKAGETESLEFFLKKEYPSLYQYS